MFLKCLKPAMKNPSGKSIKDGYEGEVVFPTSYRYNGGIAVDGKWYDGFEVPSPDVPNGYELISLGVGLQLNEKPPYCTMLLRKKRLRAHGKRDLEDGRVKYYLTKGKDSFSVIAK